MIVGDLHFSEYRVYYYVRIRLNNDTNEDVMPYLALAAKVVNVTGTVDVKVHWVRKDSWRPYSGWARYRKKVRLGIARPEKFKPYKRDTLGYFQQYNIPLKKPYEVNSWQEQLVELAGHEFAHLMPAGDTRKFRKSVAELFCELKAAEALELLRSEEGKAFIANYHKADIERQEQKQQQVAKQTAIQASPNYKLEQLRKRQKTWTTKAKRAATALKKIQRQINRLEKKL